MTFMESGVAEMRHSHRCVLGIGVLAGLMALAVQSVAAPADPRKAAIEIVIIGPYTGGSADMGISMRQGAELAAEEINRAGGLLGRPVLPVERDDSALNEAGARIAVEMTRRHPVVAGIGLVNSGVALAAEPYFEEARIPLMVSVATGATITTEFAPPEFEENYVFRFSTSTSIEAPAIVEEAVRRGYRSPAILADATSYGQIGRQDLTTALRQNRLVPVSVEKFNIGDTDMAPQLARARGAGADVILTYGIGPELAAVARGRAAMGWTVPIIGSWTLSMMSFIDGAGPCGEGASMPETFIQQPRTPRQRAFLDAYAAKFGPKIPSPVSAAQGYDSVHVLALAIVQAGSTDGPKIRAALEDLRTPFAGAVKTYDHPFSPTNHEAIAPADIVFGVVRGGRVVRSSPE